MNHGEIDVCQKMKRKQWIVRFYSLRRTTKLDYCDSGY